MGQEIYSKLGSIPTGYAPDRIVEGCLVLEGGAFRGMYTQGALDAWMQRGLNFQCTLGVSAGALAGVSYVSGQIGRSARANLGHRHDKAYIGTDALRKSKSLIRLDFLLNDYNAIEPLDETRFHDPPPPLPGRGHGLPHGRGRLLGAGPVRHLFRRQGLGLHALCDPHGECGRGALSGRRVQLRHSL